MNQFHRNNGSLTGNTRGTTFGMLLGFTAGMQTRMSNGINRGAMFGAALAPRSGRPCRVGAYSLSPRALNSR